MSSRLPAIIFVGFFLSISFPGYAKEEAPSEQILPISEETETCLSCHRQLHPGIVEDWEKSRHSRVTPKLGISKEPLSRRISAVNVPEPLTNTVVGCYECHSQNPDKHKDNFEHVGFKINVVVSPNDCKICHPVEAEQYSKSKKANAYANLMKNPVYHSLTSTITGIKKWDNGKIIAQSPTDSTLHETCLGCHGTKVEVIGTKEVDSDMGTLTIPVLSNWPNQGVGRLNPDGSKGACTSCHPRHSFSIEIARKPYTCGQCHIGPDVPAYSIYMSSKHGNIFASKFHDWDFSAVPWKLGKDFQAPTCAVCHNSLIADPTGKEVIVERTHDFGSRLWVRLFGLIYSHPQTKSGETTGIKNKDGLPLPTAFTGELAAEGLIDSAEQELRKKNMVKICHSCHSLSWVEGHFARMTKTVQETDEMTLTATKIMLAAWEKGVEDKTNPFDETIEKLWVKHWLFFSNSIRLASAMTGAQDYATFKDGWWDLALNIELMKDWLNLKAGTGKK